MNTPLETPPPTDAPDEPLQDTDDFGPVRIGDIVHKYRIEATIGRGGHAHVYRAFDTFFERGVALKILHRPGGVTKDMLRRGQTEAKLLIRLRHPNIVEVIDASLTERGDLFIVMELLTGRTLRDVLREFGKLEVDEALALFAQVADGMEAAHQKQAIHRDLKPENIFVIENNIPKVLDFGIAKVVDSAGMSTRKDIVLGTALYMSPEQLQGIPVTPRSDIFALGVMLYEALLGRHPSLVEGSALTLQEVAWRQTTRMPPLLSSLDKSIPRSVARLVNQAITKLPNQRFATMAAFAEAMREQLGKYSKEIAKKRREPSTRDLSRAVLPTATNADRQPSVSAPTAVAQIGTHDTEPYSADALAAGPPKQAPPHVVVAAQALSADVRKPLSRSPSSRKLPTPSATPVVTGQRSTIPRFELPTTATGVTVRAVLLMGLAVGATIGTGGALHHFASIHGAERRVAAIPSQRSGTVIVPIVSATPVSVPVLPSTTPAPAATSVPPEGQVNSNAPEAPSAEAGPLPVATLTTATQSSPPPSSPPSVSRTRPGTKKAASTPTDKMQERLNWLERDLSKSSAAAPAAPSASAKPALRSWVDPR